MKVRRIKNVQEPSHKKHKSKKKLKRLLRLIKSILVAGLLIVTVVYTALSPFFNVAEIKVKDAVNYDQQTLITTSGIKIGENGFKKIFNKPGKFYYFRIGSAENAIIENCPYVKSVKVRFVVPSTVTIEIKEREPAAFLSLAGTNLLIDIEGVLLEINPDLKKVDLPVFKGIKIDSYKPGKKLEIPEDTLLSAFEVFENIRVVDGENMDKLLPSVDYIDVGDIYNIRISLQSRVMVNLGKPEDLNYKMNAVQTIFTKNIKKSERGKLDFSSDENPVFTPENGG